MGRFLGLLAGPSGAQGRGSQGPEIQVQHFGVRPQIGDDDTAGLAVSRGLGRTKSCLFIQRITEIHEAGYCAAAFAVPHIVSVGVRSVMFAVLQHVIATTHIFDSMRRRGVR
jgi:hypothetical protein